MIVSRQLAVFLSLVLLTSGCAAPRSELFQYATINSLLAGVFDGDMTIATLKHHGDFGIGTFNALDGEMLALDGQFYQIRSDGHVYPAPDDMRTPFATVLFFHTARSLILTNIASLHALEQELDRQLPSPNAFHAFRLEVEIESAKTRSVPRQEKPYPTLADAARKQSVFEFQNKTGTLVGFRTPDFMQGLNVPGYHFHFLTADRQAGGHVLDCVIRHAEVRIAATSQFLMVLPERGAFQQTDLARDRGAELRRVEKGATQ
ncbi:MAG: acetolactate decarboxylase [Verrucomicrobiota bacterium]|jgi:acetolactate decarboxylase